MSEPISRIRVSAIAQVKVAYDFVVRGDVDGEWARLKHLERLIGAQNVGWDWNKAIYQAKIENAVFVDIEENDLPAQLVLDFSQQTPKE